MSDRRVLPAVDHSAESERAVRYVSRLVARNPACSVRPLHVTDPLPPATLEARGSNDPDEAASA